MRTVLPILFLLLQSPFVFAQGFDHTYEAFSGDLNVDGANDLAITGMSFQELIFASIQKGSRSPAGAQLAV